MCFTSGFGENGLTQSRRWAGQRSFTWLHTAGGWEALPRVSSVLAELSRQLSWPWWAPGNTCPPAEQRDFEGLESAWAPVFLDLGLET